MREASGSRMSQAHGRLLQVVLQIRPVTTEGGNAWEASHAKIKTHGSMGTLPLGICRRCMIVRHSGKAIRR